MTWTLDVVDVGTIPELPLAQFLADEHGTIDVPCFVYLLTTPSQTVLVDTGPDADLARRAGFRLEGDAVAAIRAALESRGRTSADVQTIVHTHLHYDHAQNHDEFPAAEVLVQGSELAWACDEGGDDFVLGANALRATLGERLRTLDGEEVVVDGIRVLPTGGHTPGHQAVVVDTERGSACIAGDAVPLGRNRSQPAPNCPDRTAIGRFLDRAADAGWPVLPGHDPALRAALATGRDWRSVAAPVPTTDRRSC